MSTMAEVVQRHVAIGDEWDGVPEGCIRCNWTDCGLLIEADEDDHWRAEFAGHVAEELAKAGFGNLADAWDEGFTASGDQNVLQRKDPEHPITRINPYRRSES